MDRRRHRPRRLRETRDLLDCLALDAKRDHEAGDLGWGGVAAHDHLERGRGLLFGEVLALDELCDRVDHACTFTARRTKLPRIFLPSLVNTDSGWNCTPYVGCLTWRNPMTPP